MPHFPHDADLDPGKRLDPAKHDRDGEPGDPDLEPDRSVARHADEAEESELAEEDILEIADLEDELELRRGEGPDA